MSKPIEPNYNKGINVLSLFDGISCGQIALHRAGIKVNQYSGCVAVKIPTIDCPSYPDPDS